MAARRDLVVTSYSLFRLEYEEYAADRWAGLFLDEAQFAKNRHPRPTSGPSMLPLPFKVAMTGTPIENNLMELWSLLSIAAPGPLRQPRPLRRVLPAAHRAEADAERLAQLRRRIRPLMLRRTKEQVARDLPDKQEQVLELDLNPRHRKVYQTYLQRERQKVLGLLGDMTEEPLRDLPLADAAPPSQPRRVARRRRARRACPSTKLDALMEMLDDIVADGHRVLVFSQFTRFLDAGPRPDRDAPGIEHCYLDGRTRNASSGHRPVPDRARPGVPDQP